MRRVVRRGGRVAVCENDISLFRLDPQCPVFDSVWQAFQEHQRNLGGDSHIGRRLYRLFRRAGFTNIELSGQTENHWHGSPTFEAWIQNLIGNIESARQGLVQSGLCSSEKINAACAEVTALLQNDEASSQFMWSRAAAVC
jgi:hypothetical protein